LDRSVHPAAVARDPQNGSPTPAPDVFMHCLPRIEQSTELLLSHGFGFGALI